MGARAKVDGLTYGYRFMYGTIVPVRRAGARAVHRAENGEYMERGPAPPFSL